MLCQKGKYEEAQQMHRCTGANAAGARPDRPSTIQSRMNL